MKEIEVYLLDDHKIVRDGLKSILSLYPDIKIAGEDSSPETFLGHLSELKFDILILDLSLPKIPGMEVLKKVKTARPNAHVAILSMHDNPEYMMKAMREGAATYLSKDTPGEILVDALRTIQKEGTYFPAKMEMKSSSQFMRPVSDHGDSEILTPKEKEVLQLMVQGKSSKQIAAEQGLSSRTIEAHRLNIMRKLGTSNSAETIAMALKKGLIN
jgi:DNA-binding NarL/FixJ family response regulator